MKFRYCEAGNQDYLLVSLRDLLELNIAGQISHNSHAKMSRKQIWLEPDKDAPLFLERLRATGETPEFYFTYNPKIPTFKRYDPAHGLRLQAKYNATQADNAPAPLPVRIVVKVEGGNVVAVMADNDPPGIMLQAYVYDADNEAVGEDVHEVRALFESLPSTLY
jgi:hypothetical protein